MRRVDLIVAEGEIGLGVVQHGDRREDAAGSIGVGERRSGEGGIEGGGVDEGLEDGAGGTVRDSVIELADAVVTAADQGQDLAGVGIEGDEGDLRIDGFGRRFAVLCGDTGQTSEVRGHQLVDVLHAVSDGVLGYLLEVRIEGGIDAEALLIVVGIP